MNDIPNTPIADNSLRTVSDEDIFRLIEEARQQYEEFMHLAELANLAKSKYVIRPKYAWDNSLGLGLAGRKNAKLV